MTRRRITRVDILAVVLYLSAAIGIGFADHRMRRFPEHPITTYMPGVLQGTYGAPAIYRPLSPWLFTRFAAVTGWSPLVSFLVLRGVTLFAALAAVHLLLRVWFSGPAAMGGTFAVAALLPLTFTNSWAHPDSFVELLVFAVGCRLVATHRDAWLAVVLAIGMLNRETTGFLALLWACDRWPDRRRMRTWMIAGVYAVIVAGVYLGIRQWRGLQHYTYWMLGENLHVLGLLPQGFDPYLRIGGLFWLFLTGVPMALALWSARRPDTPQFFKAATITAGAFVLVTFLLAAIIETRVLTPLFAPDVGRFPFR